MQLTEYRLWRWRAICREGTVQSGYTLAGDRLRLESLLNAQHLILLRAHRILFANIPLQACQEKIHFLHQTAMLLEAGILLTDALALVAQQQTRPVWIALLEAIRRQVLNGVAFSVALQQFPTIFPILFIAVLRSGEQTGCLEACCQRLALSQIQQRTLRKKVTSALRYPLFILLMTLVIAGGILLFVLPECIRLYQITGTKLPTLTQRLLTLSDWLRRNGLVISALLPVCLIVCRTLGSRLPAAYRIRHHLLLYLPVVAPLWRSQILCQFFGMLSATTRAGLPLSEGLSAAEEMLRKTPWEKPIRQIRTAIHRGTPLWQSLPSGHYFTPQCRQLIQTGEETGSLETIFGKLADWHAQSALEKTDNLTALLEPLMMILTGCLAGALVLAVYQPILQSAGGM